MPQQVKQRLSIHDLYFKVNTSGYGSNFLVYLMSYLYAQAIQKPLYICHTTSNLGEQFHLLQDTFELPPNVRLTQKVGTSILVEKIHLMKGVVRSLPITFIQEEAKSLFRLKPSILKSLQTRVSSLPRIDLGVHIRMGDKITSGEMIAIPLQKYIDALYNMSSGLQLNSEGLNLYCMTDTPWVLEHLQKGFPQFRVYALPSPHRFQEGHSQPLFNKLSVSVKQDLFYHFLAELYILQNTPSVLCTFSSNIGRYLYCTSKFPEGIKSLDIPNFELIPDQHLPKL